MKKILLIIGAVIAGGYTIVGLIQFVGVLMSKDPGSTMGMTEIAASIVPPCMGGIICLVCINALRKK